MNSFPIWSIALLLLPLSNHDRAKFAIGPKPQVLLLGVFHFASKNNAFTQKQGDILTLKRQKEIADLVQRLKAFRPTKIAVEHDYKGELNKRYRAYLSGEYVLGTDETDQIAFRLGKEIGLARIESIFYPVSFDPSAAEAYANAHGQEALWNAGLDRGRRLVDELNRVLEKGTILDGLRFFNSEAAINQNASMYLLLDRIGGGKEYPGADAASNWYASNLHIFANLMRIITSATDRVLVIYGQGHAKLLRSFIQGSPDLELADPLNVLR